MAKYNVTYRCGCTETVELSGKTSARYERIESLEQRTCIACKAKAAHEQNAGLPDLEGSVKQIAWAEQIRAKKIPALKLKLAEIEAQLAHDQSSAVLVAQKAVILLKINQVNASWWIDNR